MNTNSPLAGRHSSATRVEFNENARTQGPKGSTVDRGASDFSQSIWVDLVSAENNFRVNAAVVNNAVGLFEYARAQLYY